MRGDDLRAVVAGATEVAQGKRIAETACAACHGVTGISNSDGTPHLAGQRPAYLYTELRAYQSGSRSAGPMNAAVRALSDQALVAVAAYYASLDPPQPAAAGNGKPAPDPLQLAKAAAAPCLACHGDTGVSKTAGTPSLVGLDPKYLAAATKAYRTGQRRDDTMKAVASALSDADLANVALYFALQKAARAQTPTRGDAAAGKAAAAACSGCHGETGVSPTAANPSLAGQDAQYLGAAMHAYRTGERGDEAMKAMAAALDDAATRDVAAYYASQQPRAPNVRKPPTVGEWVQRCDRCHGTNGNSTDPRLPAIAAQRQDYLATVLHAYRTGTRKSTAMAAMSDVLTESDVEALAAYYARQKARGAVYVVLSGK